MPFSNTRPAGSEGESSHDSTNPPLSVGISDGIVVLRVNSRLFGMYERIGTGSFTVMLIVAALTPPELFAQTVYNVVERFTVEAPEITPLLKLRPFGRAG